jgi:hypothetical protein
VYPRKNKFGKHHNLRMSSNAIGEHFSNAFGFYNIENKFQFEKNNSLHQTTLTFIRTNLPRFFPNSFSWVRTDWPSGQDGWLTIRRSRVLFSSASHFFAFIYIITKLHNQTRTLTTSIQIFQREFGKIRQMFPRRQHTFPNAFLRIHPDFFRILFPGFRMRFPEFTPIFSEFFFLCI